jgi:hypothetical protein
MRMVRKVSGEEAGQVFAETPLPRWQEMLKAWQEAAQNGVPCDRRPPCPMPVGHLMFNKRRLQFYHVEPVNF